ncbi:MAG: dihydroorotase [Hyphomicrobiales bacterium]|nr:dihydroorotase [Hyphomicrobiales bacterium]
MIRPDASRAVALVNARLFCPATGRDETGGLVIENGVIAEIGRHAQAAAGAQRVDCGGALLIPGVTDMLVFTGEPGAEHRETLASASHSAAAGGVTCVIVMPDTTPRIDDAAMVDYIERAARDDAIVRVHPMAALTKRLEGREMAEIGLLQAAGAVAFSNGRAPIADARMMRLLLDYAKDLNALVVHLPDDETLSRGGVMNEGAVATRLGLPGAPCEAETIVLDRDLRLAALTRGRYHAAMISCAASVEAMAAAKRRGLSVSCGAAIANLTLTEAGVGQYRTYFKVKPPLRTEDERRALVAGVAKGVIDVIVSNHDPQDVDGKRLPFEEAAYGAIGLETMLPAALELHLNGEIELGPLIAALTSRPAELLGLPGGRLTVGAPADLAVVSLDARWTVDAKRLRSRSKNAIFDERTFRARVLKTFVGGRIVYEDGVST